MTSLDADRLGSLLAAQGFAPGRRARDLVSHRRIGSDRIDVVELRLVPAGWLDRVLGRPRRVAEVVAGLVWPLAEQAFARPVPEQPSLPAQAHAWVDATSLVGDGADEATVVAAVEDWMARLPTPAEALAAGAVAEPVRRLELAVVARDRDRGLAAADEARRRVSSLRAARQQAAIRRIDHAVQRLPER